MEIKKMTLTETLAERVRTVIIASLSEKRSDGKISKKQFQSLVEGVENTSDKTLLEKTILTEEKGKKKFWIQKAIKKPGSLHKALGVAKGKKIPAKKLKVKESDSPSLKKKKVLAKTLKNIAAKKKG